MKLVLLVGSGAVGKMTVGQELAKITSLRLFHNHMMIEPVIDIFGYLDGKIVEQLRMTIFEEFAESDHEGMIFTIMWAFDLKEDWLFIDKIVEIFKKVQSEIYCVELIADQATRLQRNKTENRKINKPSKQNQEFSERLILNEDAKYRLVSQPGELSFENYLRIDNTHLSAIEVAKMIKEGFDL